MSKLALVLSIAFLAASVAGRYQAEQSVKTTEDLIREAEASIAEARREVRALEASRAYLERPDRLEEIAMKGTDLQPLSRAQLLTAAEFVARFDPLADPSGDPNLYYPDRVIRQAQAGADASGAGGAQ
ncbi:MAG: hypothetical protein AAFR11_02220 [Pseudomonadota bacterium]